MTPKYVFLIYKFKTNKPKKEENRLFFSQPALQTTPGAWPEVTLHALWLTLESN